VKAGAMALKKQLPRFARGKQCRGPRKRRRKAAHNVTPKRIGTPTSKRATMGKSA
jgi:hypothetical protein